MEVAASRSATNAQSYKADIKKSVVGWKGSNLMGTNTHNGLVYQSKGELLIDNGQITAGTVVST